MLPKWGLWTLTILGTALGLVLVVALALQVPVVGKTIGSPQACGTCHVMNSDEEPGQVGPPGPGLPRLPQRQRLRGEARGGAEERQRVAGLSLAAGITFFALATRTPKLEIAAKTTLEKTETDPKAFKAFFPDHYDSYMKNAQTLPPALKYASSEKKKSRLDQFPYMRTLWAGYAFSKEYNEALGPSAATARWAPSASPTRRA